MLRLLLKSDLTSITFDTVTFDKNKIVRKIVSIGNFKIGWGFQEFF
jgi:hypothetical protein